MSVIRKRYRVQATAEMGSRRDGTLETLPLGTLCFEASNQNEANNLVVELSVRRTPHSWDEAAKLAKKFTGGCMYEWLSESLVIDVPDEILCRMRKL